MAAINRVDGRKYDALFHHNLMGQGQTAHVCPAVALLKEELDVSNKWAVTCRYAIKKVPIGKEASPARVLLEVSTLSGLYHAHVVRYFQAWREEDQNEAGLASQISSDLFMSRTPKTTLPAAPVTRRHCSASSLQCIAHTVLAGADTKLSEGPRQPHTSRLHTVEETSLDRAGSPPSKSAAASQSAIPGAMPASSKLQHRIVGTIDPSLAETHISKEAGVTMSSETGSNQPSSNATAPQHETTMGSDSDNMSASSSLASWRTGSNESAANSAFTFETSSQGQAPVSVTPGQSRSHNQEAWSLLKFI